MRYDPKKLLLFDAMGALVTSVLVGVILPHFENYIGLSTQVLYFLGGIAFIFFLYSGLSFSFAKTQYHRYLRVIAYANLAYCIVTWLLIFSQWPMVTLLGIGYFVVETLVVLLLVRIELVALSC
jgi:hypothetical protein